MTTPSGNDVEAVSVPRALLELSLGVIIEGTKYMQMSGCFADDVDLAIGQLRTALAQAASAALNIPELEAANAAQSVRIATLLEDNHCIPELEARIKELEGKVDQLVFSYPKGHGQRSIDALAAMQALDDARQDRAERLELLKHIREIKLAAGRHRLAIHALGKIKDGKTLFEQSPTKDQECLDAWQELNDSGVALDQLITFPTAGILDGANHARKSASALGDQHE